MKAFYIERYGKSVVGQIGELPIPIMGDDEILVKIHAASVNPLDFKIRDGALKMVLPFQFPLILGNDMAGVVAKLGKNVTKFKIGDKVYGRPNMDKIGTFAEFIAIRASDLALMPSKLSMNEAASLPLVGLTAWQALVDIAGLKAGQKILIHAGSGGVGTIAIMLAKHLGAYVATTTGTQNVAWVKELGADLVIDYKTTNFDEVLQNYDVVLDTQGGETLSKSLKTLKAGGQIISISGPPDPQYGIDIKANFFLKFVFSLISYKIRRQAKRLGVKYAFLFMRPSGEQLKQMSALVDKGIITPVIDRVFPFASTIEALEYVKKGRAKGKVVIEMDSVSVDLSA